MDERDIVKHCFWFQDLTTDVENEMNLFPSLEEEASLVHHLTTRLARYKEAAANRKDVKWKLPPTGQPITLFSGPSSPHKISMKPQDDSTYLVMHEGKYRHLVVLKNKQYIGRIVHWREPDYGPDWRLALPESVRL